MLFLLLYILLRYVRSIGQWKLIHGDPVSDENSTFSVLSSDGYHSDNKPGERFWSGIVQHSKRDVYFFGGGGYHAARETSFLCDLWVFNTELTMWKFLKGCFDYGGFYYETGIKDRDWSDFGFPGGRQCPSLFKHPYNQNRIFLFGGYYFNSEVWEYDIPTNWWRTIRDNLSGGKLVSHDYSTHNAISARACHSQWVLPQDSPNQITYFFGGAGETGNYADIWGYNITENSYKYLHGPNNGNFSTLANTGQNNAGHYGTNFTSENNPPARYSSNGWIDVSNNLLYLFAGRNAHSDRFFNDLWVFDYNTTYWKCLKKCVYPTIHINNSIYTDNATYHVDNIPSKRRSAQSWQFGYDMYDSKIFLYGGDFFEGDFVYSFGDFWEYDMQMNEFRCLMYCGDINSTIDREYNSSYPNQINSRSAGMSFFDQYGNIALFAGDFSSNDIWVFVNDEISKCKNVSIIAPFDRSMCHNHGICMNDTCICDGAQTNRNSSNNYYNGSNCEIWGCFGWENKYHNDTCGGTNGICINHDECQCLNAYITSSNNIDDDVACDQFTCFYKLPSDVNVTCNEGKGSCQSSNFCNCSKSENFYGEQCKERIIDARWYNRHQNIIIQYEVNGGYVREFNSFFFCSEMILNYEILGENSRCNWEYLKTNSITAQLVIYLGVNTVRTYDELYILPITTPKHLKFLNESIVTLKVLPEIYVFDPELFLFIVFMFIICVCTVLIVIVLGVLIWLIYKNIRMCRELRAQTAILGYFEKPYGP